MESLVLFLTTISRIRAATECHTVIGLIKFSAQMMMQLVLINVL
jgi:hypothetical protein